MNARDLHTPPNIVLGLLLVVTTVAGFALIPSGTVLPIHWGLMGEADGFLPREGALLVLPTIAVLTVALLVAVQHFAGEARRYAARFAIAATIPALLFLSAAIQVAIVLIGTGHEINMVRVVVIGVGLIFVVLGNVMPKTQPNWVAGIRLPWTLADATNWQATHRLAGLLMMLGGAAIVVAALATSHAPTLLAVTIVGALGPMVVASIYSYQLAHRPRLR